MWRTMATFCKQFCVIFVDRPGMWVTGRVCTRSNENIFDICIRNESTGRWCGMLLTWFIFERGPSFWHVRVTVSRVTRSYTFAGRTRDLWKLRSRLFRSTVNARFVVVLGSLVFLRRQTLHRLYISSLNVILVVKDTGIYLPENLSGSLLLIVALPLL